MRKDHVTLLARKQAGRCGGECPRAHLSNFQPVITQQQSLGCDRRKQEPFILHHDKRKKMFSQTPSAVLLGTEMSGTQWKWNLPLLRRCLNWRNSVNPLLLTSTSQQSHGQNSTIILFITIAGTRWTEISKTDTSFIYSTFRTWHIGMFEFSIPWNKLLNESKITRMLIIHRFIKWALKILFYLRLLLAHARTHAVWY